MMEEYNKKNHNKKMKTIVYTESIDSIGSLLTQNNLNVKKLRKF